MTSSTVVGTAYGTAAATRRRSRRSRSARALRFVNRDSFAHTATSVGGPAFPAAAPFAASALSASGDRLSTGWSSGTLAAGAASPVLLADAPGTYLYGCFFHYGAPMRAAVVVR